MFHAAVAPVDPMRQSQTTSITREAARSGFVYDEDVKSQQAGYERDTPALGMMDEEGLYEPVEEMVVDFGEVSQAPKP